MIVPMVTPTSEITGALAANDNDDVEESVARTRRRFLRVQLRHRYGFDNIIGQSPAMRQVFATLELVAPMNSTQKLKAYMDCRADRQDAAIRALATPAAGSMLPLAGQDVEDSDDHDDC